MEIPSPLTPNFSLEQRELIAEFIEVFRLFVTPGRWAVTLGGSHAKGRADVCSDLDFRVYADEFVTQEWGASPGWAPYTALKDKWTARGFVIDDFWPRTVAEIDVQLDAATRGEFAPAPLVWSVWGYHVLTDIAAQLPLFDPDGLAAGWNARLRVYPPALKSDLLAHHLEFVRYWQRDYHYASKARRGDAVFLAGLSARLVHSLVQILCALNETYFPGDGWNQGYLDQFRLVPPHFAARVGAALYPTGADKFEAQRRELLTLIAEVEALAAPPLYPNRSLL